MLQPTRFARVICAFWSLGSAVAFVGPPAATGGFGLRQLSSPSMRCATPLEYTSHPDDFAGDVESARAAFERLVYGSKSIIRDGIIAQAETQRLFLTTTGRRFREIEMDLLRSLADSDAALEELIHLWTTERDTDAASDLLHMQSHCTQGLALEEARLCQMAREYPGWAEPFARLAYLLYFKGPEHLHHADEVARRALELKPFHFEALNLLVLIHTKLNDPRTAMEFKRHALPPLKRDDPEGNQLRREWVERSLQQAAQLWEEAEHTTSAIHKCQKPKFIMSEAWQ